MKVGVAWNYGWITITTTLNAINDISTLQIQHANACTGIRSDPIAKITMKIHKIETPQFV